MVTTNNLKLHPRECREWILGVFLVCGFVGSGSASELVYTPQNPSFGGNISNGSYLLGLANAQRQFQQERETNTPLEDFNERLERSLLGRITSAVTRDIVDVNGNIAPGMFETTDFLIDIVEGPSGLVTITTTDKTTGEQSIIEVQNQTE